MRKRRYGYFILILILLAVALIPGASRATEPVTITALTLDNRPPNNLFLKQLAAIAGVDLEVFFDPATASNTDLVSLNAAAAGSLVGSRTADPWLLQPPIVQPDSLLHFAVPRVQPTVSDQSITELYGEMILRLENPDLQRTVISAIRGETAPLDDPVLADYVNRMRGWLDYLDRGDYDPDRLLITLDDNRPGPLSDGIKLLFGRYSDHVYDGTDEGMMLLLARALREKQAADGVPSTICIVFTAPASLVSVQQFESAMMIENVLTMTGWLGLRISPNPALYEPWRPILWIHGAGTGTENYGAYINNTSESLGTNPVIVADVAKPNGGDPDLIEAWRNGGTPPGLCGYLAWNTCSNTLGSAIALWASIDFAYYHTSDPEGVRSATETFLWARFLDDYLYQRLVRAEVTTTARSIGADPYHLTDTQAHEIALDISTRISALWTEMAVPLSIPLRMVDPLDDTAFTVELPWNRLFEIELFVTDTRGILPVINPVPPLD